MTKKIVIDAGFFAALSCIFAFALMRSNNARIYRIYGTSIIIGSVSGIVFGTVCAPENL